MLASNVTSDSLDRLKEVFGQSLTNEVIENAFRKVQSEVAADAYEVDVEAATFEYLLLLNNDDVEISRNAYSALHRFTNKHNLQHHGHNVIVRKERFDPQANARTLNVTASAANSLPCRAAIPLPFPAANAFSDIGAASSSVSAGIATGTAESSVLVPAHHRSNLGLPSAGASSIPASSFVIEEHDEELVSLEGDAHSVTKRAYSSIPDEPEFPQLQRFQPAFKKSGLFFDEPSTAVQARPHALQAYAKGMAAAKQATTPPEAQNSSSVFSANQVAAPATSKRPDWMKPRDVLSAVTTHKRANAEPDSNDDGDEHMLSAFPKRAKSDVDTKERRADDSDDDEVANDIIVDLSSPSSDDDDEVAEHGYFNLERDVHSVSPASIDFDPIDKSEIMLSSPKRQDTADEEFPVAMISQGVRAEPRPGPSSQKLDEANRHQGSTALGPRVVIKNCTQPTDAMAKRQPPVNVKIINGVAVKPYPNEAGQKFGREQDRHAATNLNLVAPNPLSVLDTLLEVFPRVDPEFLKKKLKEFGNEIEAVANFITSESPSSIPKRQAACAVAQCSSTSDFLVADSAHKDPILRYFSSWENFDSACFFDATFCSKWPPGDSGLYRSQAMTFMQNSFREVSLNDLRVVLKHASYRYVLAVKALKGAFQQYLGGEVSINVKMLANVRNKVAEPQLHELDKTLAMEKLWLERKPAREAELKRAVELEKQKFDDARAAGAVYTCEICCDDSILENMRACNEGHMFCKVCLQNYAQEAIYGQGKRVLTCLLNCDAIISEATLRKTLTQEQMLKLEERIQHEEVTLANLENLIRCTKCGCSAIVDIPVSVDKVFKCPKCKKESCRICNADWEEHFGKPCREMEDDQETKLRREYEEKMAQAVIRECPRCKKELIKEEGCNKLTCVCGATMCYLCRTPHIDYNHFCQHPLDPGKACDKCQNPCMLFEKPEHKDIKTLQVIEEEAKEAQKKAEIARKQKFDEMQACCSSKG